jgi:SAM-dependent methyltransferase
VSLGRRKVGLEDASRWVFNRMADVYDARPPYPAALVATLAALAPARGRVADLGAGIGHLALPLAAGGFDVTAVEPARDMLARLREAARDRGLPVRAVQATAEATGLDADSVDLVVVADALHFIDAERVAAEIARVLRRGGALAVVTAALADTPYMRAVAALIDEAVPRRPRALGPQLAQISSTTEVPFTVERAFADETPVERETLERILRSISFIGPAMNAARFSAFRARVHALPGPAVWARTFTLRAGRRVVRRESPAGAARFGANHLDRKKDPTMTRFRTNGVY